MTKRNKLIQIEPFDRQKFLDDFEVKYGTTFGMTEEQKDLIMENFIDGVEELWNFELATISKQVAASENDKETIKIINTAIETINQAYTKEYPLQLHNLLTFFQHHYHDTAAQALKRNFRPTLPEDKHTPIWKLKLNDDTIRELNELSVMHIGELETIAYWHDKELTKEPKLQAILNVGNSPILSHRQLKVNAKVEKDGTITVSDEDAEKLRERPAHIYKPMLWKDVYYSPNRLSKEAYIDIDQALAIHEKAGVLNNWDNKLRRIIKKFTK